MTNEIVLGCPECYMAFGMNACVSRNNEGFQCTANPAHKFKMGNDGFLKTL